MPKIRRKIRLDLSARSERKEVEIIDPLQLETSTSISHLNDLGLPTSFGKKSSRSQRPNQSHYKHRETKRSSMLSPGINIDEPFDICLPKPRRQYGVPKSFGNEKNREMWVPKVQPDEEEVQHKLNVEMESDTEHSVEEIGQVLRPGMVLFKGYIPLSEQVEIVKKCQELGRGPGGFYRPGFDGGAKLRLNMMCLGLDWNPQTKNYREKRQHDDAKPPNIPHEFASLVYRVLHDSHALIERDSKTSNVEDILPRMSPDVCIVNFYATNGRLGLHQDRDESQESLWKGLPVVSFSIGDSAEFLYGDSRDVEKAENVILESGDVLIFGGESRLIFHGVTTIIPNTAPCSLIKTSKLKPGRLNLTFRKY
ncbi:hypothetical protein ACJIZ3_019047 [Penstemon smallii]|uniref:DNA N(6)-methyladenine demethylase n=1 Tax=Penstemon smallii TaxID=265156 RepID=A0ABD3T0Z2_9LAMI